MFHPIWSAEDCECVTAQTFHQLHQVRESIDLSDLCECQRKKSLINECRLNTEEAGSSRARSTPLNINVTTTFTQRACMRAW